MGWRGQKKEKGYAKKGGLWVFLGSLREFWGKVPGKLLEKNPESRNALNSRISGTGKRKPAANIGSTLPWNLCRPSVRGIFRNRQLQRSRVFLSYCYCDKVGISNQHARVCECVCVCVRSVCPSPLE